MQYNEHRGIKWEKLCGSAVERFVKASQQQSETSSHSLSSFKPQSALLLLLLLFFNLHFYHSVHYGGGGEGRGSGGRGGGCALPRSRVFASFQFWPDGSQSELTIVLSSRKTWRLTTNPERDKTLPVPVLAYKPKTEGKRVQLTRMVAVPPAPTGSNCDVTGEGGGAEHGGTPPPDPHTVKKCI